MKNYAVSKVVVLFFAVTGLNTFAAEAPPKVPAFSFDYMDRSVSPATNFYHFAAGSWLANNPVPADKARWASFSELAERNWYLIHEILDSAAATAPALPK